MPIDDFELVDDNVLRIAGKGPLRGTIRVPGDKSISHRALMLGALANGTTTIRGLSQGEDVACTRNAMEMFGVELVDSFDDDGNSVVAVHGQGRAGITEPTDVIDVGNSGTSMRLVAGIAASFPFLTVLTGDVSLRSRPMGRVIDPLTEMGARFSARNNNQNPPLVIEGTRLQSISFKSLVASAQVKSAVLLAGLGVGESSGAAVVYREPVLTRMHTEEMLIAAGVSVETEVHRDGSAEHRLRADGRSGELWGELSAFDIDVPGDPSQAAFWLVAGAVVPGSDVTVENVYFGPGRGGLVDVLARMGANLEVTQIGHNACSVRVQHGPLSAAQVGGPEVASLIDELPVLSVAAAFADGATVVRDASELRVKESDRIAAVGAVMHELGGIFTEKPDGFDVQGNPNGSFVGGSVDAGLDHRIAMTAAIGALMTSSPVTVSGWQSVRSSYPGFLDDLLKLRSN